MPAQAIRLLVVRETQRKTAHGSPGHPAPRPGQPFACLQQRQHIHGLNERRLGHLAHPDDRLSPAGWLGRVQPDLFPQQLHTLSHHVARHSSLQLDEPITNEPVNQRLRHGPSLCQSWLLVDGFSSRAANRFAFLLLTRLARSTDEIPRPGRLPYGRQPAATTAQGRHRNNKVNDGIVDNGLVTAHPSQSKSNWPPSRTPSCATHYYLADRPPFLNLSDITGAEPDNVIEGLGRRGAVGDSQRIFGRRYMDLRRLTEARLRELFVAAGGKPEREAPHYFVLGSCRWFRELAADTQEVVLPLSDLPSEATSFTYPDSFTAMGCGLAFGLPDDPRPYHGTVFRMEELEGVVHAYGLPDDSPDTDYAGYQNRTFEKYIEVQLLVGRANPASACGPGELPAMSDSASDELLLANRANWDDRTAIHLSSRFYDVEGWLRAGAGPRRWEIEVLGDVSGLRLLHLQCHIGLDTLAWARAGATVTGLDFSLPAVTAAGQIAERAGLAGRATFVCADVLNAAAALDNATFDIVYVSLGALCWIPDIDRWAEQVGVLVASGGRLYLHDGHPLAWALSDNTPTIEYSYFEENEPFIDDSPTTYTDAHQPVAHSRSYEWNHSIGEIVSALIRNGLQLESLQEYDWTVRQRFPWLVQKSDGTWTSPPGMPRIPLTFSLLASRAARTR